MARPAMTPAREGLSLAASLAEFSAEQLVDLLRARPDLAQPAPRDLAALVARASTWASVNACMVSLNRAGLQLLDTLSLLPQPTSVSALVVMLGVELDADDLDDALNRLVGLGLVFRRRDELRLHPQIEQLSHPAGLGPPASSLLVAQQQTTLIAIAKRLGINPGRSKSDTVAALAKALNNPAVLKAVLPDAPPGTAALVSRLSQNPVEHLPWGTHQVRTETPLGWLAGRGFVVATDWSTFVMPREVGLAFRGGQPFPGFTLKAPDIVWRPVDAASVDRGGIEAAHRIVADIAAIVDSWMDVPPKLLKAGGLGVREVRRAATLIGRSETEAARVIELAAASGLAGWDHDESAAGALPAYEGWLQLDVAERWATVARAWLDIDVHVNLAGAIGTNEKPIPPLLDRWPESPAQKRRTLVLAALMHGGVGHAIGGNLTARVAWDAPALWTGGPATTATLVSWVSEEAAMLGLFAAGSLTSLGRLAADGRLDDAVAVLARQSPPITSQFVIQADLTAVATGPLSTPVRADLDLMADLESSGSATVFRFSEQSLRRAYDAGWSAPRIVEFLTLHATKGVPQPLAYLVEDIGRRHGRLRVGAAACYLRSEDASVLTEILLSRRTAKLGLRQLAPTVLAGSVGPEVVVETLRASGYLPAEEDRAGDLVVRRREVVWAQRGLAPAAPEGGLLPAAIKPGPATVVSRSNDESLASIARRLLNSVPKKGTAQSRATQPGVPVAPNGSPESTLDALFPVLDKPPARPTAVARSRRDISEIMMLAHVRAWYVRIQYLDSRGRSEQMNATVSEFDLGHVRVKSFPGGGTKKLSLTQITWARVMTEAEENQL